MILAVDGDSADLIARDADRPSRIDLVISLHNFASRLRQICGECEQEIFAHTLLNGHTRGGILIVAAERRIDLQAGNARQALNSAGYLPGDLACEYGIRAGARGACLGSSLAIGD